MKKKFLFLLFFLMFIPMLKINAKVCNGDNVSSFGAETSNSTVYGYTCPRWKYAKVYGFQNDDMVVICYPGTDTDNKPAYFVDLYASKNNQCVKKISAAYFGGKSHQGVVHEGGLSWSNLRIKTVNGQECPVYMYQKKDTVWVESYDVYLTDDVNEYNKNADKDNKFLFWTIGHSTGGGTIEDIISEDKVKTCVNDYINSACINNANASETDLKSGIKEKTKACVEEAERSYGVALDQAAVDRFTDNVSNKIINSELPKLVLECQLMKKCTALKSFKKTNSSVEQSAIISIYNKTATVQKLINSGVPSDLANCLMNNSTEAIQETEEIVDTTTQTVEETTQTWGTTGTGHVPTPPHLDPASSTSDCKKILGNNLTNIVKASITILQIVAAIMAIIKGMITLIPAITSKDTDGLKKAEKQLVTMAIILAVIFLLKPIVSFIGGLFDYDLSCIL